MTGATTIVSSCLLISVSFAALNDLPLIGVLLQKEAEPVSCLGQYTMAAYKSFIEQGGGGAVPIFVNQPEEYYEQLMSRLNGVLMPGGDVSSLISSPFSKAASKILSLAMKMNENGNHFPLWGTCQGFEQMTVWPTNTSLLTHCSQTEGVSLPVNLTAKAKTSKLLSGMPQSLLTILTKENVTPNFHSECLSTKTFDTTAQLQRFYDVLSTNLDGNGLEFVSTWESKKYPFYGVQWHPEKINFFHLPGMKINRSLNATLISQYMGNFLVQEARKNYNTFKSLEEAGRFMLNSYASHFGILDFFESYCISEIDIPPFE